MAGAHWPARMTMNDGNWTPARSEGDMPKWQFACPAKAPQDKDYAAGGAWGGADGGHVAPAAKSSGCGSGAGSTPFPKAAANSSGTTGSATEAVMRQASQGLEW
jgi:hypothetical protein